MKLILKNLKPRNPWAHAAGARQAGAHGASNGARRQMAQQELQKTLRSEWDVWRKTI